LQNSLQTAPRCLDWLRAPILPTGTRIDQRRQDILSEPEMREESRLATTFQICRRKHSTFRRFIHQIFMRFD
jgi:hypothetical protein